MRTREFTGMVDGKEVAILVVEPSLQDQREAGKIYNNAFTDALKSKAVVRARLDDLLIEQGLWSDIKQKQFETIQKALMEGEKALAKGGISLSKAREIAIKMREDREELKDLISVKTNLDQHTAEGQADNAKFNYLVFACTIVKDTKQKAFGTYEQYQSRAADYTSTKAAQLLANMIYGLDDNFESKLPENKFLQNYSLVDDKLRLINKEGKLVNQAGHLVDESGRLINAEGKLVDREGNVLDSQGDYAVDDFKPFTDEEGKPIEPVAEMAAEPSSEPEGSDAKATKSKKNAKKSQEEQPDN